MQFTFAKNHWILSMHTNATSENVSWLTLAGPPCTSFDFCLTPLLNWATDIIVSKLFHVRTGDNQLAPTFLPARRYASAGYSDRNVSVCLFVRPSVTRRYCVKTKKASDMISSPYGSPKTLVFWRQISSPNSKGFLRTGASNKGRSEKFSDFLALSLNISKTVADTAKVTISD